MSEQGRLDKHEYEGGRIIGDVDDHYHVSYYVGEGQDVEYEDGEVVCVNASGFSVNEKNFDTLNAAVRWCFDSYATLYPGKFISPVWGAGAPNKTLEELGFTHTGGSDE